MSAYYNEIDPFAADWLENLIEGGHIAPGVVDRRDIRDVVPDDLTGFDQCHFFAGVGGWSLAFRLAGWPDDRPVWTGSCPCQPFSQAGRGDGFADERHLWPHLHWLIEQRRPPVVFGEQVASKAGLGWIDLVLSDLEGTGYAVGVDDLCAAGIGAPHIRQRLWWVADARLQQFQQFARERARSGEAQGRGSSGKLAGRSHAGGLADADHDRQPSRRLSVRSGRPDEGAAVEQRLGEDGWPGPVNGFWRDADWIFCRDGKWRPVESGTFPLAHGIPNRVGRLRAYGNAIVPQVAAEVIRAFSEVA